MPEIEDDGASDCKLLVGDCVELLSALPGDSVDAVVTDPPYGLEFMGKEWDKLGAKTGDIRERWTGKTGRSIPSGRVCYGNFAEGGQAMQKWHQDWAEQVLRVLKPGAWALVFGGSRTYHRLACALEDAGFEIRDCVMWLYGSGFPKNLDVSKAIDKHLGAEREKVRTVVNNGTFFGKMDTHPWIQEAVKRGFHEHAGPVPITAASAAWQGWGTALKPAYEPIIVARKLLDGTVAENVLKWGVGGLNIGECRVGTEDRFNEPAGNDGNSAASVASVNVTGYAGRPAVGRWPANMVHDGSDEVLEAFARFGESKSPPSRKRTPDRPAKATWSLGRNGGTQVGHDDEGTPARFFYSAKCQSRERGEFNNHPTVKPIALIEYLIKLVCPKGGLVLDPFTGSGTTALACKNIGRRFVGCEREPDYAAIAEKRLKVRELNAKMLPPA